MNIEREAAKILKRLLSDNVCVGNEREALSKGIEALESIALYKHGGLCLIPSDVYQEQCQELDKLKEKNTPKKPYPPIVTVALGSCGVCNTALFAKHKYCHNCGQATDWERCEMKKPAES